jgi:hypothetical protein
MAFHFKNIMDNPNQAEEILHFVQLRQEILSATINVPKDFSNSSVLTNIYLEYLNYKRLCITGKIPYLVYQQYLVSILQLAQVPLEKRKPVCVADLAHVKILTDTAEDYAVPEDIMAEIYWAQKVKNEAAFDVAYRDTISSLPEMQVGMHDTVPANGPRIDAALNSSAYMHVR